MQGKRDECGAALAIAIIIVAILAVVAVTALTFSSTEARIAGSDLQRTQAFYAAVSSMEKMTNDFSELFHSKMSPTSGDLSTIANSPPAELTAEGFAFTQSLAEDTALLNQMRATQNLPANIYPRVNIPEGPYSGLYASIVPYKMSSTATQRYTKAQVQLEREFNNYLVPLFQFGIFSSEDVEVSPGPLMTFNGRVHSNGNIYASRNTKFLNRITMAGEFVRDATRGGEINNQTGFDNVWVGVGSFNVQATKGSVQAGSGSVGGPNLPGSTPGTRGYYPGSPNGVPNPNWETTSVRSADGTADQFGGQVLTNTTGANLLKIPLELEGNSPAELIKRSLSSDSQILSASRFHTKSEVRILIDDEAAGTGASNSAGIPTGQGVLLRSFNPLVLDGGKALRPVTDSGTYASWTPMIQKTSSGNQNAMTVRGVRSTGQTVGSTYIPPGANLQGRILIQIVKSDGTTIDVTQQILSMGMTEGEPNGIVYLQRPLWAAYVQGSRDRSGGGIDLVSLINSSSQIGADGELGTPVFNPTNGFITNATPDDDASGSASREITPGGPYNQIVPINVYNVREGWYRSQLNENNIYERGMTQTVEINMHNLARWLDGLYDTNLLAGTSAVSANIKGDEGYVVYISDRRGDKVKTEYLKNGTAYRSANGTVDNEDIYGPNNRLDDGEDVIDYGWDVGGISKKGTLQKDTTELPDTGSIWCIGSVSPCNTSYANRQARADAIFKWSNYNSAARANTYFRQAVRLFNGEKLSFSAAPGKLSPTKGITVATENMVYIWGNYNTTGITDIPVGGSTTNEGGYTGPQVPASIVADAFFPLSKTWFDGLSALYPEGSSNARAQNGTAYRMADDNLPSILQSTSVRAGIIAGTNLSTLTAIPGRDATGLRRSGGIINYPRFLEIWNLNGNTYSWNYAGSFIPLFHSTQALSNWENDTAVIYMPPRRNWSFDTTFLNPSQLPPGTPFFQYIQATGFRQKLR
jgi:PilX N-terminal